MEQLRIDGARIAHHVQGDGEPMLLIDAGRMADGLHEASLPLIWPSHVLSAGGRTMVRFRAPDTRVVVAAALQAARSQTQTTLNRSAACRDPRPAHETGSRRW